MDTKSLLEEIIQLTEKGQVTGGAAQLTLNLIRDKCQNYLAPEPTIKPPLAYEVYHDNLSEIVHAQTRTKAIYNSDIHIEHDVPYSSIRAKRRPELDKGV
jgi:hypothetical protein